MYKKTSFKFLFVCGIVFIVQSCGSTTEFLPEFDFRFENPHYQKKSFDEVETTYTKPTKPFQICGEIFLRNFQEKLDWKEIEKRLKKEAFQQKLDGVWIRNLKKEEVPPMLIFGKNQTGGIINYQEIGKEVAKIQAIGFRYKQHAN